MAILLLCVLCEPNNTTQAKVDIHCSRSASLLIVASYVWLRDLSLAVLNNGDLYLSFRCMESCITEMTHVLTEAPWSGLPHCLHAPSQRPHGWLRLVCSHTAFTLTEATWLTEAPWSGLPHCLHPHRGHITTHPNTGTARSVHECLLSYTQCAI